MILYLLLLLIVLGLIPKGVLYLTITLLLFTLIFVFYPLIIKKDTSDYLQYLINVSYKNNHIIELSEYFLIEKLSNRKLFIPIESQMELASSRLESHVNESYQMEMEIKKLVNIPIPVTHSILYFLTYFNKHFINYWYNSLNHSNSTLFNVTVNNSMISIFNSFSLKLSNYNTKQIIIPLFQVIILHLVSH